MGRKIRIVIAGICSDFFTQPLRAEKLFFFRGKFYFCYYQTFIITMKLVYFEDTGDIAVCDFNYMSGLVNHSLLT